MLSCRLCNVSKEIEEYSKTQLRKKNVPGHPRCKKCTGNEEVPNVTDDKSEELIKDDESNEGSICVPPKRLVCIKMTECDFCDNPSGDEIFIRYVDFELDIHTGWQVCYKCNQISEENQKSFVIEKVTLLQMFDDGNFKVLRNPKPPEVFHKIETGWYIMGNAMRHSTCEDYLITIYKEQKSTHYPLTKNIDLKNLQDWQSPVLMQCPICITDVVKVGCYTSDCGHTFCNDCIETWRKKCVSEGADVNCPICRKVIAYGK